MRKSQWIAAGQTGRIADITGGEFVSDSVNNFYIISIEDKDYHQQTAGEIKSYLEKNEKCARIVGSSTEIDDLHWADMAIVLGGDGSVIQAAKHFAGKKVPILGVNFGTLGFLTEVEREGIPEALDSILSGRYEVERRMALAGRIENGDEPKDIGIAANEFIIGKRDVGHMITTKVFIGDSLMDTYVADGIIISTPTGSTAYNLSAAGPILVPGMEAMVITPICPHSLNKRSIVVPADARLCVEVSQTKDIFQDEASIRCDGGVSWSLSTGDRIFIEKADVTFDMVRLGEVSFFDKMRSKLNRQ